PTRSSAGWRDWRAGRCSARSSSASEIAADHQPVMSLQPRTVARGFVRPLARIFDAAMGWLTRAILRAIRLTDRRRTADFWAGFMRKAGPWLPEHRVG